MKNFQDILRELNACYEAREWASDKTIEQVVAQCHRGDWLLWLAYRLNVDYRKLTLAKAHCANTVRHLMEDERSTNAIDVAISYGEGNVSKGELDAAATYAADAADAADAIAAASAAYAAAAAYADARKENQMLTADICRKYICQDIINIVNSKLQQQ